MAVIRVHKDKNYTVMSNTHFKEREMSLKAKGLLSLILSLPDDWKYTISGLATLNADKETSVKSGLKELEKFGYMKITKLFPNETKSGRIEYEYDIFEKPKVEKQEGGILPLEVLDVELLDVEEPVLLNTNKLNTNNKINNIKKEGKDSANTQKPLLVTNSKPTKKNSHKDNLIEMINTFSSNIEVTKLLNDYLDIRIKRGLTLKQWGMILDELREYAKTDSRLAIEEIKGAIMYSAGKIVPDWKKSNYKSKSPSFDNTAGNGKHLIRGVNDDEFNEELCVDEDGELLEF